MGSETKNPIRYSHGGIECWDAMEAAFGIDAVITFCKLNAFKYIWREKFKAHEVDMEKAKVYIEKWQELTKRKDSEGYAE